MHDDEKNRIVAVCAAAEPLWREMFSGNRKPEEVIIWPTGMCAVTSLMLVPILRKALVGCEFRFVLGKYDGHVHGWIETDELIIDPTFGQFHREQFGPDSEQFAVISGYKGKYESIFVFDREGEEDIRESVITHDEGGTWIGQSHAPIFFNQMYEEVLPDE